MAANKNTPANPDIITVKGKFIFYTNGIVDWRDNFTNERPAPLTEAMRGCDWRDDEVTITVQRATTPKTPSTQKPDVDKVTF